MNDSKRVRSAASRLGLCFLALVLISQTVQLVASVIVVAFRPDFAASAAFGWILSFVPLYGIGLPVFMLLLKTLMPEPKPERANEKLSPGLFLRYFVLCLGTAYVFNFLTTLFSLLVSAMTGHPLPSPVLGFIDQNHPAVLFLFVCVLAPLGEEFICRKLVYDHIGAYGKRVYIVVSAAAFSMLHGNFAQFFYAFALGLIFGMIYAHTGKLIYTIVLHGCINFVGTVAAPLIMLYCGKYSQLILGIYVIVMLAAAAILFVRRKFWIFAPDAPGVYRVRDALTSPGMLALFAVCIGLGIVSIFTAG